MLPLMGSGWGAERLNEMARQAADADTYRIAYEYVVTGTPPPDDDWLLAAAKIVMLAQDIAASGVATYAGALDGMLALLEGRRRDLTHDQAITAFGLATDDELHPAFGRGGD